MSTDVIGSAPPHCCGHAPTEHPVELVDKQIHRDVGIFGSNRGRQIGTGDFDATFGREDSSATAEVVINVNTDPENAGLVTKKTFSFSRERNFHGVS